MTARRGDHVRHRLHIARAECDRLRRDDRLHAVTRLELQHAGLEAAGALLAAGTHDDAARRGLGTAERALGQAYGELAAARARTNRGNATAARGPRLRTRAMQAVLYRVAHGHNAPAPGLTASGLLDWLGRDEALHFEAAPDSDDHDIDVEHDPAGAVAVHDLTTDEHDTIPLPADDPTRALRDALRRARQH